MNHLLMQINATAEALEPVTMERETLFDIISRMGIIGIIVIGIIFVLSIIAVFIFFERYQKIKKATKHDDSFIDRVKQYVTDGKIDGAIELCRQVDHPSARMIEKGILRLGKPVADIKDSIETVANLEIYKLEKNLNSLATISGVAPMLGFFGTVTGMINAFFQISQSGNNIDPGQLAGGIYEAMITTAFGLAVGIVSYMGYNFLVSMVEKTIYNMELSSVEFIDLLLAPTD